jgi:hypothetical protein
MLSDVMDEAQIGNNYRESDTNERRPEEFR